MIMAGKAVKTLYILGCLPFILIVAIRVCDKLEDYNLLNFSGKNCHESPVSNKNISEIIRSWPDFTAEEHYIITEDGYKLLVERSYANITQKTPLLIVHGMGMNAMGWVYRHNASLAYSLGKLGYDVWMLSYRGSWYSKGHVNLNTNDKKYWNFNLNELGIYDVRSTIKLVKEKTQRKPIYIGYSMGTTGFFIYSSSFPEEAKNSVKAMIGVSSATNFKETTSLTTYTSFWWPMFRKIIYNLWSGEVLPGYSVLLKPLLRFTGGIYTAQYFFNLVFGDNYEQIDASIFPLVSTHLLDIIAVDTYSHYVQVYDTGLFRKFDYGNETNLKVYGSTEPPAYDLSKNQVPVAMISGKNDWLITLASTNHTYSQLHPSVRCGYHVVPFEKWNHIDFLMAKDVKKYFYKYLFYKIKELDKGFCNPT
ncbi:unnamed protein product [Phyllotreta striolata]|uniref:Lipase n=1 Tax=Phyllotreta striolata TaxID=444603 RepID=A0A9N9TYB4_PHYSR|nr:unnamed protein product [Phyllotreta striolata]